MRAMDADLFGHIESLKRKPNWFLNLIIDYYVIQFD